MKKNIVLLGALAFALVAQTEAATVTKVKFVFNGYYQGVTKTNSVGVITTRSSAMVPFKITDADVLAWNGASASAYLIAADPGDVGTVTEVDIVDGANTTKVLDLQTTGVSTYVEKDAQYANGTTQWKYVDTRYSFNTCTLPESAIWGGVTKGTAVSTTFSGLSVNWAGVSKSSSAGVNGKPSSSAASHTGDNVVGKVQLILPHKTTDEQLEEFTFTGVIVSGAVRAAEVTVK